MLLATPGLLAQESKPLILENADSLAVSRRRGHYMLFGDVRFFHDSVRVFTEEALWDRNRDRIQCQGGFEVFHPSGRMKSKAGSYSRRDEVAIATGDVVAVDSSGENAMFAQKLIYERQKGIARLPVEPEIHRYYPKTSADSLPDTLSIRADYMEYIDSLQLARALGNVLVTRGELTVTCDSGFFYRDSNVLQLYGSPKVRQGEHTLTGDYMRIGLEGEKLKSVLVVNNAIGTQRSKASGDLAANRSRVSGDTIFAEFRGDKMKRIRVVVGAKGQFFEEDIPDLINTLHGSELNIDFDRQGQMQLARAFGQARSTYWYVNDEREAEGRNEATGDTLRVRFSNGEVYSLEMNGNVATGIFYGAEKKGGTSRGSSGGSSAVAPGGKKNKKADSDSSATSSAGEASTATDPAAISEGATMKDSPKMRKKKKKLMDMPDTADENEQNTNSSENEILNSEPASEKENP